MGIDGGSFFPLFKGLIECELDCIFVDSLMFLELCVHLLFLLSGFS